MLMPRWARRWMLAACVVALAGASCGDDGGADLLVESTETSAAGATTTGAVSTTAAATTTVVEASGATTAGVLLSDDFQDGDAAGWDIDSGWYVLGRADRFVLSSGEEAWAWWPGGLEWDTGYALRASVRFDAGGVAISAAVGTEGRYVVHLHEDGTYLLRDRPWGSFETLAQAPPVASGVWHAIAFGIQEDRLLVLVDGERILEYQDGDPLQSGSVGFGATADSIVAVDNVLVTLLGGPLPVSGAPSGPAADGPDPGPVDDPPDDGGADGEGLSSEPDFSIVNVTFDDTVFAAGQPIGVTMRISNDSDRDSDAVGVAWSAGDVACTAAAAGLAPHAETDIACTAGGLAEGRYEWTAHVDHDERFDESDETDNVRSGTIEVGSEQPDFPNLGVWSVAFHPEIGIAGEPFEVGMAVADLAPGYEGALPTYTVRIEAGGVVLCSEDTNDPEAVVTCTHSGLPAGDHQYVAVVDAGNDVDEGPNGEVDNTLRGFFHVEESEGGQATYDLEITSVRFLPDPPRAGEEFNIQIMVLTSPLPMQGGLPDYTIRWILDDGGIACEWGVTDPAPTVFCPWVFSEPGSYGWRVVVNATRTVAETLEGQANNERTGSVTVDIGG